MDILLLEIGVLENLLDRLHGLPEQVHVQFLELGPGQCLGEVVAILERFDLDPGGLLRGQGPLSLLNLPLQLAHGPEVLGSVSPGLLLVELDEVVDNAVVEIFTTKVSITGSGQDFEDTLVNGEERNVESSTTEIVDDDLGFTTLLVKTIRDGGGGRLIDDAEDLETSDSTGILGSLTLGVVEVGGDGDDGVGDLLAEVSLSGLFHLGQNHSGDFFGGEIPLFATVLYRDGRLPTLLDNLEWPV